ncbi:AMP-binding protein [Aquicoccus porphyridii]|uniref:acetate--CoA ligase n=2 Tax=Paracoccaceae TaxID=31989 RepID=A0A5A9Z9M6_9RHOB|nr:MULTISPECIES: AMP-binding protein [Paracoccaceae]KAA0913894.1 AMP-binding protein [Aquicoccus porphyridii]MDU9004703.1 AMP-binding protein [Sedimentitalea todarodis]RAI52391.1 AMP-dependent synthetase [Rhodobacteraceae bacterium AsT-22]
MFRPDSDIQRSSTLTAFLKDCGIDSYKDLARRANEEPDWFWSRIIDHAGIRFSKPHTVLRDISDGPESIKWAVGGTLNLTETCLDARIADGRGEKVAIDWVGEDGSRRRWTYSELAAEASRVASALAVRGVRPGQAVGIYMPMIPEIEAALLGIARLGAVAVPLFSGFAPHAIISRLNDSGAVAVLTADATPRRGKPVWMEAALAEALTEVPSVHTVVSLRRFGGAAANPARDLDWTEAVGAASPDFAAVPVKAEDPFLIAYTSGTTGRPKGVVHTHLGVQAKATADFLLCLDMKQDDRHLWMTDMGWVMGPLTLLSVLLSGSTLVVAEGAPSMPGDPFRLLRLASEMEVTHLGVAPTLVRQFMTHELEPLTDYDLSPLRIVASTGEPWTEDAWRWQLDHICRRRAVPLNISGGTELFGAILTSTVLHEIKPGGFSAQALGVGAKVLREDGSEAAPGEVGELVVTQPPLGLTPAIWGDRDRYLETYWSTFPGLWRHGDWVRCDPDGTWFILGRSDDTLNIAGKRIGPPEIEAALTESGEVVDAAAIAAPDDIKGVAVVCVCVAAPDVSLDADLVDRLKDRVGEIVSKPFRPREIHFVEALPKTRSMKTMRRVVRAAFLGEDPGDLSSISNPETIQPIADLQKEKP